MPGPLTSTARPDSLWPSRVAVAVRQARLGDAVPDRVADAIVAALSRAAANRIDHVERLVDLGIGPSGDVVLTLEATPHRLADLLAAARPPSPGETVTVLAPLVGALQRLHAARVAHGQIDIGAVRFDAAGAPMLCGFESAVLAERTDASGFEAACAADRIALEMVAVAVLRRAGVGAEQIARVATGWADPEAFDAAADALFDVAPASAVCLSREPSFDPSPARLIEPAGDAPLAISPVPPVRQWGRWIDRASLVRVVAPLRAVRRRTWIAAGSGLATLVAAIALLPAAGR